MWIVIVIVVFVILIVLASNNTKKPPEDIYSKTVSESIKKTNDLIDSSRKILAEIQEQKNIKIATLENEATFEVTGIHIADRKNRIKKTCEVNDEVIVSAEPKNKFDPNAIMVQNHKGKLGYIMADDTEEVHRIIKGEHYSYISYIDDFDNYLTLEISIKY